MQNPFVNDELYSFDPYTGRYEAKTLAEIADEVRRETAAEEPTQWAIDPTTGYLRKLSSAGAAIREDAAEARLEAIAPKSAKCRTEYQTRGRRLQG